MSISGTCRFGSFVMRQPSDYGTQTHDPLNVRASVGTGRWESQFSSQHVNDSVLSQMFTRGLSAFLVRSVIDEAAFRAKLL